MEVVYYNNADYEQFLLSHKKNYQFQLSKINKEFEYFILITEDNPLYTDSQFSKEYSQRIKNTFAKEFHTTKENKSLTPWCMPLNTSSKIVSKKTAMKFNQDHFGYSDIKLVSKEDKLKDNTYYVLDGELSGRGHYLFPRDRVRIQKLLNDGHELICEPKRERKRDISTLFLSRDEFVVYENIIDQQCQYKGTLIKNYDGEVWYQDYLKDINKIHDYYKSLGIQYPFSIDSYFYSEGSDIKLKVLSEVNARKTMGWMANWLHRFFSCKESFFYISRYEFSLTSQIQLNPKGKLFNCYFIPQININEINKILPKI
jgi:hypothetical protein